MGYLLDIKGHTNMQIDSDDIPRMGESVSLIPDTFDGQEEALVFRVKKVTYTLGRGFVKELPIVMLEPHS